MTRLKSHLLQQFSYTLYLLHIVLGEFHKRQQKNPKTVGVFSQIVKLVL